MRTYQEILVDYMYFKVGTLYELTKDPMCFDFLAPEDISEMEFWNNIVAESVASDLLAKAIRHPQTPGDAYTDCDLCPWCLYQGRTCPEEEECDTCSWGSRHGYCRDDNGLYQQFCKKYLSVKDVLNRDSEFMIRIQKVLDPNQLWDPDRLVINLSTEVSTDPRVVNLPEPDQDELREALTVRQTNTSDILEKARRVANIAAYDSTGLNREAWAAVISCPSFMVAHIEHKLRRLGILPLHAVSNGYIRAIKP